MNEFEQGVVYAVFLIMELHDNPVICADVLKESNLSDFDASNLDYCEKKAFKVINKETGMNIKNL
ncbi:TPA: hypothetical protein JRS25_004104 [Escherichia coli]|nr:hypothetical protein [Escherichia coli]